MKKIFTEKDRALSKLQKYCAYQERCHQEVRSKLIELKIYGDDLEEIIAELISDNFLNEERFAIAYAGGKFRMKKWGKVRIRIELKKRKISDYCIKKAMQEIDEEGYMEGLYKVIEKKIPFDEIIEQKYEVLVENVVEVPIERVINVPIRTITEQPNEIENFFEKDIHVEAHVTVPVPGHEFDECDIEVNDEDLAHRIHAHKTQAHAMNNENRSLQSAIHQLQNEIICYVLHHIFTTKTEIFECSPQKRRNQRF